MSRESAARGGPEEGKKKEKPNEVSEMLDAANDLAKLYVNGGSAASDTEARRMAVQSLHSIRGANSNLSVADAFQIAKDSFEQRSVPISETDSDSRGGTDAGEAETVLFPPTNPDVADLPSNLDDAIDGQSQYPDVFVEQEAPESPVPVPYPAGLRDHDRPRDFFDNEKSRDDWNAARQEFYDAYMENGQTLNGLNSPRAAEISAARDLAATELKASRASRRRADNIRKKLAEASSEARVSDSGIPPLADDSVTRYSMPHANGETVTVSVTKKKKTGSAIFLSTDPHSVNPLSRKMSTGLIDADSNLASGKPLRSKTYDASESAAMIGKETTKARTKAARAALEAEATPSSEQVDDVVATEDVPAQSAEYYLPPLPNPPALPPLPDDRVPFVLPPFPPLPPIPRSHERERPGPTPFVDPDLDRRLAGETAPDSPIISPVIPRPLERPAVIDDPEADRIRHAEEPETPPAPLTDPAEAATARPDLHDLNPHLVRPDAAGIPPNTPPSAEARAYAAGLMNRPTIKGRILSGLAWPFKKIGKGIAEVGNWAGFHFDRAYDNVAMNLQNGRTDRAAAKFEAEKAGFEVAKAKTLSIQGAIAAIDKEKADNKEFITPKIAKRMERARRDLEMKLIKAQEAQDQGLRRIKLHEGRTIAHENKRTEIARHYAALVDNRMKPKREAQQALQERKAQYEEEIREWSEKVAAHQEKIAAFEARAKKNPYCKSAFKGQLKAARRMLADSEREVEKRRNKITGAFGIDSGMFRENLVRVNNTLRKWENRMATYSRTADRKIAQYDQGAYIGSTPAENIAYRNPVENVAAPAGTYSEEDTRAREAALESAPNAYSFDDWVNQWNSLNGSKLRLDPDSMFDSAVLREYRAEGHVPFDANEFAGIVKVFLRKKEVAASSKLKAKDVAKLTGQALESLRQKAADAAVVRETTA